MSLTASLPGSQGCRGAPQLYSTVDAAFSGRVSAHELLAQLQRYEPALLEPLSEPPPRASDRTNVESGQVVIGDVRRKLSPEFIVQTLALSDKLRINELRAAELLQHAVQQHAEHGSAPGVDVPVLAEQLFHEQRRCLLSALLTLIKARLDEHLPAEVQSVVVSFTNHLVADGAGIRLLQLVKHLSGAGADAGASSHANAVASSSVKAAVEHEMNLHIAGERRLAAECVFFIVYQLQCTSEFVLQLLGTCRTLTAAVKNRDMDAALRHTTSIMVLACISALDQSHQLVDPATGDLADNLLVADVAFPSRFGQLLLDDDWDHVGFRALLLWAWALFLGLCAADSEDAEDRPERDAYDENIDASWNAAVAGHAFDFVRREILASAVFINDTDHHDFFVSILDELITSTLEHLSHKVRELKQKDEQAASASAAFHTSREVGGSGGAAPPQEPRHDFAALLNLVADVYADQPPLVAKFWDVQQRMKLHHFVRFAGDYLTPGLFVPYVRMLTGLASGREGAEQVYLFMKSNSNPLVNWDHFFQAIDQYVADLQPNDARDTSNPHAPTISEDEVDRLTAILGLVSACLQGSETNRIVMYENPHWRVLYSLFGLLASSVPQALKTELLHCLASFARSPEIASHIFTLVEATQLLPTIPAANGEPPRSAGIHFELEEIMSRTEDYSELIAFLALLRQLIAVALPHGLGADHRVPGFLPYLTFIRDAVFVKFDTRGYSIPSQRWLVAANSLHILASVLDAYQVVPDDFAQRYVQVGDVSNPQVLRGDPPPGFVLMHDILSGGPVLRKILSILALGSSALAADRDASPSGAAHEDAVTLCLRILHLVMERERDFIDNQRQTDSPVLVTSLGTQLMRDRAQILKLAGYLAYAPSSLPALYAVRLISALARAGHKVVEVFREARQIHRVVSVFAQRMLEPDEAETMEPSDLMRLISLASRTATHPGSAAAAAASRGRVSVAADADVDASGDVGDDVTGEGADVAQEELEQMRVAHSVRYAIVQAVIDNMTCQAPNLSQMLLGYDIEETSGGAAMRLSSGPSCLTVIADLLSEQHSLRLPLVRERSHQMLYCLAMQQQTSSACLGYLRSRDWFVSQFRSVCGASSAATASSAGALLNAQAWVLKLIAVELHVSSQAEQPNRSRRLLALLFSDPSPEGQDDDADAVGQADVPSAVGLEQRRMRMLEVLDTVDMRTQDPPALRNSAVYAVPWEQLRVRDERGVTVIAIEWLYRHLVAVHQQHSQVDVPGYQQQQQQQQSPHPAALDMEAYQVLQSAVELNAYQRDFATFVHVFDAWRAVVEVVLVECFDWLDVDVSDSMIYELLEALLQKLPSPLLRVPIAAPISGVVLLLMTKLRERCAKQELGVTLARLPVDQLHTLLRDVIASILRVSTSQLLRGNLYATLLNYLRLTSQAAPADAPSDVRARQRLLADGNYAILEGVGERLVEVIARDAGDCSDVWKSVAFATLDALIACDRQYLWLAQLGRSGALRHVLEELTRHEHALMQVLGPNPASLNPLFIYESRMYMLLRIAQSEEGAIALTEHGALQELAACRFLDQRPVDDGNVDPQAWLPAASERYHMLMVPALRILCAVTSALPRNVDVAAQTVDFLVAHAEVVEAVLRDQASVVTIASLDELRSLTQLMVYLAPHAAILHDKLGAGVALRWQSQLLHLLGKYAVHQRWWSRAAPASAEEKLQMTQQHPLWYPTAASSRPFVSVWQGEVEAIARRIRRNLVAYARLVSEAGQPMFSANLVGATNGSFDVIDGDMVRARSPPLAVVVHCVTIAAHELSEVVEDLVLLHAAESNAARKLAAEARLQDVLLSNERRSKQLRFELENALLVLWRHLSWFVSGDVPTTSTPDGGPLDPATVNAEALRSSAASALSVAFAQLEKLSSDDGPHHECIKSLVRQVKDVLAA